MTAITITPISKEKKSKQKKSGYVCIISDDEDLNLEISEPNNRESANSNKQTKEQCNEMVSNYCNDMEQTAQKTDAIEIDEENSKCSDDVDSCIIIDDKYSSENDKCEIIQNSDDTVSQSIPAEVNDQHCTKNIQDIDQINLNEKLVIQNLNSTQGDNSNNDEFTSTELIETFLDTCKTILINTEYDLSRKIESFKHYYLKCEKKVVECEDFKKLLENSIKKATLSPYQAVICFGQVFMHLKDLVRVNTVEVTKKEKVKLKKLEHTIKLLVHKIKELENAEVDFSEDEDSTYVQLDRYSDSFYFVTNKLCFSLWGFKTRNFFQVHQ